GPRRGHAARHAHPRRHRRRLRHDRLRRVPGRRCAGQDRRIPGGWRPDRRGPHHRRLLAHRHGRRGDARRARGRGMGRRPGPPPPSRRHPGRHPRGPPRGPPRYRRFRNLRKKCEVTSIPLVDLAAQHAAVADEVAAGWREVLAATAFIGGPQVAAFERAYAEFVGVPHCVGTGNGTDAIEIALRALGIGQGDECILPANTFIATAEAVARAGATPVLVDCADDDTYLIDDDAVAAAVTPRTAAIIPVHLYGQAAPVERLSPLAKRTGAWVVEDAAQAHGARRDGKGAGSLGDVAATSFYPGKNLGAYGDAGAVLTGSSAVADRMRMIADHGSPAKYRHEVLGVNSRLDTLQAVVLSAKLRRLAAWN